MTGVHPEQFAPVAVVSRSNVDESVHFGAVVCLNEQGHISFSLGDPAVQIFPRSSTKPFQALAMARAGLSLPPEQLALVCSSHNGEEVHLSTARSILKNAGVSEEALRNIEDHPWHVPSQHQAIREGRAKSSLQMNCSGKHSGMVATCRINGWPTETYLEPDHPLQVAITDTITEITGAKPVAIGVDGCGAPAHVIELHALARGLRAIATGAAGEEGDAIFEAMSHHPYILGGDGRHITKIVSGIPHLIAKDGAESVYVAAVSDGRAVALKLSDGSGRATPTVLLAALRQLGVDTSGVAPDIAETVLGHGKPVGSVRAVGFTK